MTAREMIVDLAQEKLYWKEHAEDFANMILTPEIISKIIEEYAVFNDDSCGYCKIEVRTEEKK